MEHGVWHMVASRLQYQVESFIGYTRWLRRKQRTECDSWVLCLSISLFGMIAATVSSFDTKARNLNDT